MKLRGLIFALLSVACMANIAEAQKNIVIRGVSENGAGRRVELLRYADPISQLELLVDSSTIDADGHFQLRCYSNYPMLVTMQIENYSQSFYVEPAKEYDVIIPSFDWNLDEKRNVFLEPEPLPLLFQNVGKEDVNLMVDSIDRTIARFLDENWFHFDQKFKPSPYYFDSLQFVVSNLFPKCTDDFINRYKVYQLAEMKYALKFDSRKNLIDKFIKNQPILYYDENYMSLFSTLYAYSISKGTKDISIYRLAHWVYNLDLDTYIDSIGMDPLLRHEQVRELAALQALRESYYNFHYYDAEMVVKMIEKLASRTKFPEHKKIAQNILESISVQNSQLKKDECLNYVLPNVDKQPVSLQDLKGKWVYIAFVRVNDPNSISEIETMAHFKEKLGTQNNDVEFVTIACDREFQKMFHFLKNTKHGNKYNWTWLHFDGNYDLLRRFQVTSYPWFVLINPEGKLQYDITPAPSTGFMLIAPWLKHQEESKSGGLFH